MQNLTESVAVVTGAASGIGAALARRFAREGMRVALADIETPSLTPVTEELSKSGHDVLGVTVDVSDPGSVDRLADAVYERFGACHVLCNNAGVSGGGAVPIWTATQRDWEWILGVNLMGVIHGIQSFVPRMIDSGEEGHVVNTASIMGLATGRGSAYAVSKHAVVRLSEGLYYDLRAVEARLGVSVICPGGVATRIATAERNRPERLRDHLDGDARERIGARHAQVEAFFRRRGVPPEHIADAALEAIIDGRFYVLTHDTALDLVNARFLGIQQGRPLPARRPAVAPILQDSRLT